MKKGILIVFLTLASLMSSNIAISQTASDDVDFEALVTQFYSDIKHHDVDAFLGKISPNFEIISYGIEFGGAGFTKFLIDQEKTTIARGGHSETRFLYELKDFETLSSPEMTLITFTEHDPHGNHDSANAIVLVLSEDQWLVDRFVHNIIPGTERERD